MIYLDNGATSLTKPKEVKNAVVEAIQLYTANAGRGAYSVAQSVSMKMIETRENLEQFFGGKDREYKCIFTPSCSYALNLAIRGFVRPRMHIITTYLEHNSVLRTLEYLRKTGIVSYTILHDLSEQSFVKNINRNTKMIITTHISNVTGEEVDTEMVSKICKKYNLIYLLDTAQGAGHIQFDVDADMIAFAGHKGFKGLIGVSGLLIKPNIRLNPVFFGGTGTNSLDLNQPNDQVEDFEIGSQSGVLVSALNAGVIYTRNNIEEIAKKEEFLTQYLINKLDNLDFLEKYYNPKNCHSVISFNIKNIDSSLVGDMLNENYDVCVRTGFHCAPLVHLHNNTTQKGMVRASLNEYNSCSELDEFVSAIKDINFRLKSN